MQQPAFEYSAPQIGIVTPTAVFVETVGVQVSGFAAISGANPLTMNVTLFDFGKVVTSKLNLTEVRYSERGAYSYPANPSSRFWQSSVITLKERPDGIWTGQGQVVYFESGTFNGTIALYNKDGFIKQYSVPDRLQVSGEDVTFSFVTGLVGIALTLVLIAFVVLELRNVGKNAQPKGQQRIDRYVGKPRGKGRGSLRRKAKDEGHDNVAKGEQKEQKQEPKEPSPSELSQATKGDSSQGFKGK